MLHSWCSRNDVRMTYSFQNNMPTAGIPEPSPTPSPHHPSTWRAEPLPTNHSGLTSPAEGPLEPSLSFWHKEVNVYSGSEINRGQDSPTLATATCESSMLACILGRGVICTDHCYCTTSVWAHFLQNSGRHFIWMWASNCWCSQIGQTQRDKWPLGLNTSISPGQRSARSMLNQDDLSCFFGQLVSRGKKQIK